MLKTILITGAGGFIGNALVKALAKVRCNVVCLVKNKLPDIPKNNLAKIKIIKGDITDSAIWRKILPGVDVVFHLAAQTDNKFATDHPVEDLRVNVTPVVEMLEYCRTFKLKPDVIFSSTITTIGLPKTVSLNINQNPRPQTVYDLHKLLAEQYLLHYIDQGFIRGAVLSLAYVFGPGHQQGEGRGVLNLMIKRASLGEALTIYGKGNQLRDYIYIDDVVSAFLAAWKNIEIMNGGKYAIGTGHAYKISEAFKIVAKTAEGITNNHVKVSHVVSPQALSIIDKADFVANPSNFTKLTGWKPKVSLKEGIRRVLMTTDTKNGINS